MHIESRKRVTTDGRTDGQTQPLIELKIETKDIILNLESGDVVESPIIIHIVSIAKSVCLGQPIGFGRKRPEPKVVSKVELVKLGVHQTGTWISIFHIQITYGYSERYGSHC